MGTQYPSTVGGFDEDHGGVCVVMVFVDGRCKVEDQSEYLC